MPNFDKSWQKNSSGINLLENILPGYLSGDGKKLHLRVNKFAAAVCLNMIRLSITHHHHKSHFTPHHMCMKCETNQYLHGFALHRPITYKITLVMPLFCC